VCLTLLAEVPWTCRVWALPFLSALAPSERYCQERGKRHKKITEWAWQMLLQLRRWQPHHEIIAVADGGYASLKLLDRCRSGRHHPPNSPKFSCEPLNFGEFTFFALG